MQAECKCDGDEYEKVESQDPVPDITKFGVVEGGVVPDAENSELEMKHPALIPDPGKKPETFKPDGPATSPVQITTWQHDLGEDGAIEDLRDVHNLLAFMKRTEREGKTDKECTKRLFKTSLDVASLEVVLVDTTHGTNKTYHNLFSILVDDDFDKNPATEDIRGVVTGKDFKDWDMLIDALPQAREMLCQFHVIDYLRSQVGSRCQRGSEAKKDICAVPQLVMKAESAKINKAFSEDKFRSLGSNKKGPFFLYFEAN
ncbi:hypothetical protein PPTG_05159 [Phytophthora nicotianae INRA-310]|uniref:MULE transposase domain-containing protein n=1 Tax=Phytophthora nicotianae (strain INRA-310) TaxID=761204 RepID=W2QYK4_PHYN3|nr:hypothetical protein PPTG_05159 [Phytophthora nicotianae INRA-310]ETN17335.1 hypothetical protein PPTG_05159 [Phytophthora nicotianae INRA-310]